MADRLAALLLILASAASCRACEDRPKLQRASPEEEALQRALVPDAAPAPAIPPIATSTLVFTASTTARPAPPPADPWLRAAAACGGKDLGLRDRFTAEEVEAACKVSSPITDVTVIGRVEEWRRAWGTPACPLRVLPGEVLGRVMLGAGKGATFGSGYRVLRNRAGVVTRAELDLGAAPPCVMRGELPIPPDLTPEAVPSLLANCAPTATTGATRTVTCETGAVHVSFEPGKTTLAVTRPSP